jgi:hypothetical protein
MIATVIACFRKPIVIISLTVLSLWGYGHWQFTEGQAKANQDCSLKWSHRNAVESAAIAKREASERTEEQRRQQVVDEEQKRTNDELAKIQNDAADALRASDGLQLQLAILQRQLEGSETSRISALAAARAAKTETTRMLAQLLSESDKIAGIYAAEADRAYTAGRACEQIYEKIAEPKKSKLVE